MHEKPTNPSHGSAASRPIDAISFDPPSTLELEAKAFYSLRDPSSQSLNSKGIGDWQPEIDVGAALSGTGTVADPPSLNFKERLESPQLVLDNHAVDRSTAQCSARIASP